MKIKRFTNIEKVNEGKVDEKENIKSMYVSTLEHGDEEFDPFLIIKTNRGEYKVKLKNLKPEDDNDEFDWEEDDEMDGQ